MEGKQMGGHRRRSSGFVDYLTLFVNTFLKNGLNQASILVHTGHLPRPDLFISVPGWLANLAAIVGCLWVYASLPSKQWSGGGRNGRFLRAHYCAVPAALLGPFPWLVASAPSSIGKDFYNQRVSVPIARTLTVLPERGERARWKSLLPRLRRPRVSRYWSEHPPRRRLREGLFRACGEDVLRTTPASPLCRPSRGR